MPLELNFSGGLFYTKKTVVKFFDQRPPLADLDHGLEPHGGPLIKMLPLVASFCLLLLFSTYKDNFSVRIRLHKPNKQSGFVVLEWHSNPWLLNGRNR